MLSIKWNFQKLFITCLFALLASCTSFEVDTSAPVCLYKTQRIAILPFNNDTETPQADERAATIVTNMLRARGMRNIVSYPAKQNKLTLIPGVKQPTPRPALLAWARKQGASYAF